MEPKDISKKHFYISLVKSLVRIAASVMDDRRYDLTGRWWIARFGRSVGNRGGTLGG